jgi:hypothetical protein
MNNRNRNTFPSVQDFAGMLWRAFSFKLASGVFKKPE